MKQSNYFFLVVIFHLFSLFVSAQWTPQNSGTTSLLTNIFFLNKDTGFISHELGGMRKTINGGSSWTFINTGITIRDFHFFTVDTGICISNIGIYRTVNGGSVWNPLVINASLTWYGNLFCLNNNNLYAAAELSTDSIVFFKSLNKGDTWSSVTFDAYPYSPQTFFTSADTGYILSGPGIYKSTDSGATWVNTYFDTTFSVYESNYFISNNSGFILGATGELLKTTDGGYTWIQQNTNGNDDAKRSMTFVNSSIGYTVGGNGFVPGFVLKTIDGGDNWTLDCTATQTLEDVYFPSQNIGYACGWGGIIIKYVGDVGLGETESLSVLAYPNPTSGIFTLQTTNQSLNNSTVTVFNSLGDVIFKSEIRNQRSEIDLSNQPDGVYLIKVLDSDKVTVKKIVKM